jgi:transcriptional regulator with XRE-family HTH domain
LRRNYGADEPPRLGPWLEAKRKERGLSQEALARALDLSLSSVRNYLNDRSAPDYWVLYRLRQTFGSLPWEEDR